jgi:hypothetical protein
METRPKRQALLLGGLLVALVVILWWNLSSGFAPSDGAATTRPARPRPTTVSRGREAAPDAPVDVALEALRDVRSEPAGGGRNPFQFSKASAAPPPDSEVAASGPDPPPMPAQPPGPPPVPPIPLKFIGIVEEQAVHRRLAALSDGRFTYYGREGDIIEGRYRIVRIGLESIEMSHVDGRGAQTIRLTGS